MLVVLSGVVHAEDGSNEDGASRRMVTADGGD